jgi:hypothetical protein
MVKAFWTAAKQREVARFDDANTFDDLNVTVQNVKKGI